MSKKEGFSFVGQDVPLTQSVTVTMPSEIYARVRPPRIFSYGAFKRGFDLVMSTCLLVALSPVFLLVAIAIKLDSPGPVLFRQIRTGKKGVEFEILKFRSMVADNDIRDKSCEDKYTRVGKFLRRTSIDELPQLINVLLGQMAFIGPRPWVPEYWDNMNERERGRVAVRPGITGLAAARGRNGLTIFEKINYDLEYVNGYSLRMDVKVIFLTAKQILVKEQVNAGKKQVFDDIEELKRANGNRDTVDISGVVIPSTIVEFKSKEEIEDEIYACEG